MVIYWPFSIRRQAKISATPTGGLPLKSCQLHFMSSATLGDSSKVFCAIASNELSLSSQLTIFDIVLSVDFVSQLFQLHVPR